MVSIFLNVLRPLYGQVYIVLVNIPCVPEKNVNSAVNGVISKCLLGQADGEYCLNLLYSCRHNKCEDRLGHALF